MDYHTSFCTIVRSDFGQNLNDFKESSSQKSHAQANYGYDSQTPACHPLPLGGVHCWQRGGTLIRQGTIRTKNFFVTALVSLLPTVILRAPIFIADFGVTPQVNESFHNGQ
jgi:hypothetical protein